MKLTVAEHKTTKMLSAVKTIFKEPLADPSLVIREVAILRKLQPHPRIVALFDVFETPSEVSIVTEYSAGGDLLEALAKNEFYSEADAAIITKNICEAIAFMHSKNIVHRFLRVTQPFISLSPFTSSFFTFW